MRESPWTAGRQQIQIQAEQEPYAEILRYFGDLGALVRCFQHAINRGHD
jgi:hypothetical protein